MILLLAALASMLWLGWLTGRESRADEIARLRATLAALGPRR